jgi:hypothetical protein
MNAEQRIRLAIGDLVIQLQAALARIAELENEVAQYKSQEKAREVI